MDHDLLSGELTDTPCEHIASVERAFWEGKTPCNSSSPFLCLTRILSHQLPLHTLVQLRPAP
jgi:hypothetical protein